MVGCGRHAEKKLIPALLRNGQKVSGIVSGQPIHQLPPFPIFRRLKDALEQTDESTLFIIATPPSAHFRQAREVLLADRDVLVEKPVCARAKEVKALEKLCREKRRTLVEGYMHMRSRLYRRFLRFWIKNRTKITAIEIRFRVPSLPPGTFRDQGARKPAASCLYDFGCYAISLFADLRLPLEKLHLAKKRSQAKSTCQIFLQGVLDQISVDVVMGLGDRYENSVSVTLLNGQRLVFQPFFYGRSGTREISFHHRGRAIYRKAWQETDAFQKMFRVGRKVWLQGQPGRLEKLLATTRCLERLSRNLFAVSRN